MPNYGFWCERCSEEFEEVRHICDYDKPYYCPKCRVLTEAILTGGSYSFVKGEHKNSKDPHWIDPKHRSAMPQHLDRAGVTEEQYENAHEAVHQEEKQIAKAIADQRRGGKREDLEFRKTHSIPGSEFMSRVAEGGIDAAQDLDYWDYRGRKLVKDD